MQHLNDLADRSQFLERYVQPVVEGESQLRAEALAGYLLDVNKRLQQRLKIETQTHGESSDFE